jgi:hypothetical protein
MEAAPRFRSSRIGCKPLEKVESVVKSEAPISRSMLVSALEDLACIAEQQ